MQEAPFKILVPSFLGRVLIEAARPRSLGEAVLMVDHNRGGELLGTLADLTGSGYNVPPAAGRWHVKART